MSINKKTLELAGHKITIKKLPMGKIATLIEGIKDLPPEIKEAFGTWDENTRDADFLFEHLPVLLTASINKVSDFLVKASNSDELTEKMLLEEFGFDDGVDLVEGILEVNNVRGIIDKIKKMVALYTTSNKSEAKRANPMINKR